ncbi:MFS general substrate transporter [Pyrenochaeta sp. DS3sAY3a]|nr:MFS general substrate transporter [Pyrenochaeta sp. DS3sAY3a]
MPLLALNEIEQSHGTIQLISEGGNVQHKEGTSIVLVPQPTLNDPNDPLNWPYAKRIAAFWSVLLLSGLCNFAITGISPGIGQVMVEFGCTLTEATWLISACLLGNFWGCYFLGPFALRYGKRPVWLFCVVFFFVCNIWAATAKSFVSLLLARFFASWAAGTSEPLSVGTVDDLFFLHERGTQTGVQAIWLSLGSSLAPVISGYLIQGAGWRWFQWLTAIMGGVNVLLIFFLTPETQYPRDLHKALDVAGVAENNSEVLDTRSDNTASDGPESKSETNVVESISPRIMPTIPKKSYWTQLKPWSPVQKDVNLVGVFVRPWATWAYPSVIWAVMSFSIHICAVVVLITLIPVYMGAPPYNFSVGQQGLVFLGPCIGNLIGSLLCGNLNDALARWTSRRNGGVFEPEMRLPVVLFPALLVPTGLLMFGLGVHNGVHWIVPTIGAGLNGVALTGIGSVAQPYMMDAYAPVIYDCLVNFNGFKNVVSFAMGFGVIPWLEQNGIVTVFCIVAALVFVIDAAVIFIYIYGKQLRERDSRIKIFLF